MTNLIIANHLFPHDGKFTHGKDHVSKGGLGGEVKEKDTGSQKHIGII